MVRRISVLAVLALALVACGSPAPPDEPAPPGPAVDQDPAASPDEPVPVPTTELPDESTASPAATAAPPLDELVVRTGGVGPLAVGVPPDSNPGAAMIEHDPDACADVAEAGAATDRWVVSAYPDGSDEAYHGGAVRPLHVDADDEAVHRIDVLGAAPRTAEGVGVGTPTDDLRATYPALEGPYDNLGISQVWWLVADDGTLVFETQGEASGLREPGAGDTVILMRVLEPGASPEWGAANSGNVAGACL